jgi:hypothetical protein
MVPSPDDFLDEPCDLWHVCCLTEDSRSGSVSYFTWSLAALQTQRASPHPSARFASLQARVIMFSVNGAPTLVYLCASSNTCTWWYHGPPTSPRCNLDQPVGTETADLQAPKCSTLRIRSCSSMHPCWQSSGLAGEQRYVERSDRCV